MFSIDLKHRSRGHTDINELPIKLKSANYKVSAFI